MDVGYAREAIVATLDSPCRIGMMGGEPALHPKFTELLELWEELVPKDRRELWVAGFKWGEYKEQIQHTFFPDRIHYNDHYSYDGKHAPLLVAIDDVVDDPELKRQLIDNCPFQSHWSASVTPKGGFFCEIAASLDWLFDGPGGYPMEPGWWDKGPKDFQDQVDRYCGSCSGAIPQPPLPVTNDGRGGRSENADYISSGMLRKLEEVGSPKVARQQFVVWDKKITREDIPDNPRNPREFRSFVAHNPDDVKKITETAK